MLRWLPALCLVGCNIFDGSDSGPSQTGELGNGEFFYSCDDCGEAEGTFPNAIAVGGRFGARFAIEETDYPVNSAAPAALLESGNTFQATKPGTFAILARSGPRIVDMLHLDFQLVERLELEVEGERVDDNFAVATGETVDLRALPFGSTQLGGALDYTWTVDDADLLDLSGTSTARATGVAAGTTMIHVAHGDITAEIMVFVGGTEPPRRITATSGYDPSASDTDASASDTDASSGGETDAATTGGTG